MSDSKIYVAFHIGRKNGKTGQLSYIGEHDFQGLIADSIKFKGAFIVTDDYNEEKGEWFNLPDEEWTLTDKAGNPILKGREEIEATTGYLEWDGEYDTDYVTTTDKLSEREWEVLLEEYPNEIPWMSENLRDAICAKFGMKRAYNVKGFQSTIEIYYSGAADGFEMLNWDDRGNEMYTEEEWREYLSDEGFCPVSVEKIIQTLRIYQWMAD